MMIQPEIIRFGERWWEEQCFDDSEPEMVIL
jgi:hypothetical protein